MADTKINGALFQSMVTEGALAITEQKEQINELNVFPVPDGDTGTNMSMTMTAAMNELAKLSEPTLAKAADTTASALLRGARGNSGVILSLLFRERPRSGACAARGRRYGVQGGHEAGRGYDPDRIARCGAENGRAVSGR